MIVNLSPSFSVSFFIVFFYLLYLLLLFTLFLVHLILFVSLSLFLAPLLLFVSLSLFLAPLLLFVSLSLSLSLSLYGCLLSWRRSDTFTLFLLHSFNLSVTNPSISYTNILPSLTNAFQKILFLYQPPIANKTHFAQIFSVSVKIDTIAFSLLLTDVLPFHTQVCTLSQSNSHTLFLSQVRLSLFVQQRLKLLRVSALIFIRAVTQIFARSELISSSFYHTNKLWHFQGPRKLR